MRFIYLSLAMAAIFAATPVAFAKGPRGFGKGQQAPAADPAQAGDGVAAAGAEAGAAAEQGAQQTGQRVRGFMGGPGRRGQARAAIQACLQNKGVELPAPAEPGTKPVLDDAQKEALQACIQDVRNAAAAARAANPRQKGFGKRQAEAAGQRDTASADAAAAESAPADANNAVAQ